MPSRQPRLASRKLCWCGHCPVWHRPASSPAPRPLPAPLPAPVPGRGVRLPPERLRCPLRDRWRLPVPAARLRLQHHTVSADNARQPGDDREADRPECG